MKHIKKTCFVIYKDGEVVVLYSQAMYNYFHLLLDYGIFSSGLHRVLNFIISILI